MMRGNKLQKSKSFNIKASSSIVPNDVNVNISLRPKVIIKNKNNNNDNRENTVNTKQLRQSCSLDDIYKETMNYTDINNKLNPRQSKTLETVYFNYNPVVNELKKRTRAQQENSLQNVSNLKAI